MPPSLTPTAFPSIPLPGTPDRALLGFERLAAGPSGLKQVAERADGRQLLAAVFGSSPFLSQLLQTESDIAEAFLAQDAGSVLADLMAGLEAEAAAEGDGNRMARALRRARRRAALVIALADIAGQWDLEQVTAGLTGFADLVLRLSVDHLLRRSAETGDLLLPSLARPSEGSGLVVLAMGKLGAGELNYSSDIDLILLYDRDKVEYRDAEPCRTASCASPATWCTCCRI